MNSSAATFAAPPPRQTINEARTPWETIILLGFVCIVLTLIILWHIAVFLLDTAGYPQPDKVLAETLIFLVGLTIIVALACVIGGWFVSEILAFLRDVVRNIGDVKVQVAEKKYSFDHRLPATVAAATTSEQQRLYHAAITAMNRGYDLIDKSGSLTVSGWPWSRRSVARMHLPLEAERVGDTALAGDVRPYLLERGILLNDTTINLDDFPDINAVKRCLDLDLGRPIVVNGGRMSGHYIERGGGESWGQ